MAVLSLVISSAGESKGGLLRRLTESENDAEVDLFYLGPELS